MLRKSLPTEGGLRMHIKLKTCLFSWNEIVWFGWADRLFIKYPHSHLSFYLQRILNLWKEYIVQVIWDSIKANRNNTPFISLIFEGAYNSSFTQLISVFILFSIIDFLWNRNWITAPPPANILQVLNVAQKTPFCMLSLYCQD